MAENQNYEIGENGTRIRTKQRVTLNKDIESLDTSKKKNKIFLIIVVIIFIFLLVVLPFFLFYSSWSLSHNVITPWIFEQSH